MKNIVNEKRNYGVDIIRILATVLVLSVHFFLNTYYYKMPEGGFELKIQNIIRSNCMLCVPLFLVITGFLNNKKEYDKKFFKGLFEILLIWFFYSLIETITINVIDGNTLNLGFKNLLFNITSFKACHYSWYIEMFIGLYLMAPVINVAYTNLDSTNRKRLFIISILIGIAPYFINTLFAGTLEIPDYWIKLYPLTYYILGKFIADIKPKFKKKNLILLIILNQVFIISYQYLNIIDYYTLPIFIETSLVFLLLYNIDIKNNFLKKIIKFFSSISLDIYLASSLIDQLIYPIIKDNVSLSISNQQLLFRYMPIIVIGIFTLSSIYALVRKLLIKIR